MTDPKTPEWVFDIVLIAILSYTTALYFNGIWTEWWQPILGDAFAFGCAIVVAMIYSYFRRHWKP